MTMWEAPAAAGTARRLVLAGGLSLVHRDQDTLQIGLDPARRVLVRNAPSGTAELLLSFNGQASVGELTHRLAKRHRLSPDSWDAVIEELIEAGFLSTAQPAWGCSYRAAAGSQPDYRALAASTDAERAGLAMIRRRDAVAVVVGTGRVAGSVATVLAAAGVGHVHLDPDRAVRPTDVSPAGLSNDQLDELGEIRLRAVMDDRKRPVVRSRRRPTRTGGHLEEPRQADREALAAMIRRVSATASVHSPGVHLPPDIVVLASDGPVDQVQLRRLAADRIPHLVVRYGELRGVVGPLVLPGRSSCPQCHDLHRRDRDPSWPKVLLAQRDEVAVPPAVLATAIAAAGADQVLQHLDGLRTPDSVDGTLELHFGQWLIRRRSWQPHPSCFCQYG